MEVIECECKLVDFIYPIEFSYKYIGNDSSYSKCNNV